jgi:gamma-glutamyltranspeptidase/glutathione hydrolase
VVRCLAHYRLFSMLISLLFSAQLLWAEPAVDYSQASSYARSSNNGAGAVATVSPLATQAGIDVLQAGGNAIDAAVAAALTLGVVDSHNSGIGSGNFALLRYADGRVVAIDGREMAPQAAHRDMYLRDGKVATALSKTGALAVGVPGGMAVYDHMLKTGGKFSLAQLLLPAADLAEQGFALSQVAHDRIVSTTDTLALFPASAAILLDAKGKAWPVGHRLIQKDLAHTYRQIADHGIDYFYRGDFAKAVDGWMQANDGIVRYQDFVGYQLKQRQAVKSDYRGYAIYGFPPPSSGGVHVAQILNMLERFDLALMPTADRYHVMVEAMKLAFADRAHFLGDPDFVKVPKSLFSQPYADRQSATIDLKTAANDVVHGEPAAADSDFFGKHTTHISTADRWGNWVSITATANTSFGSKVIIPGTGVIMNNQMDDFSSQPGVPNAYGLVGKEANSVQPGKRPLSSMSPTIVVKDGKPIISIGAAGGPTIITQVVQGLVNMIDLGMSVEQALATPRVHHQWRPTVAMVEKALAPEIKASLETRGHKLYIRPYSGSSQAIRQNADGSFEAAAEPRIVARNR